MATNSGNGGVWNESDHPRDSDGKFTDAGGGTGPAPTAKTKAVSDKVKKRRADGITIRDPSVSMRVPDSELCKGDVEADEIRLPKSTDKPDEDTSSLPPPEKLKKLYGEEFTGVKGTAALKSYLWNVRGM